MWEGWADIHVMRTTSFGDDSSSGGGIDAALEVESSVASFA